MDLPNLTLVVQIFNFFIAYWLLRKYIFEPALHIIIAQDTRIEGLNKKIDVAYVQQQQILVQQKTQWSFIKSSLLKLIPNLSKKLCATRDRTIELKVDTLSLSEEEKQAIQKLLHDEMVGVKR